MVIPGNVLSAFGIDPDKSIISVLTSGHINNTFKVERQDGKSYILQSINTNIFKNPEYIAHNIRMASDHLRKHHPDYFFPTPIPTIEGGDMFFNEKENPWRLFPYIPGSLTIDELESTGQAFHAAREFGRLNRFLSGADEKLFYETIPGFQDLNLRYNQFLESLEAAPEERKAEAATWIMECKSRKYLVDTYLEITGQPGVKLRIIHNDTKINNVLFNSDKKRTIGVIDLDTLMPGYFFYDLGDMVRTFVSPVSEEEKDHSRIIFRSEIYKALLEGYLSEMAFDLTELEKSLIVYSGKMMTFIMALRFLADFLNEDVYYKIHYPTQNLVRSSNQLTWLKVQEQHTNEMEKIAKTVLDNILSP